MLRPVVLARHARTELNAAGRLRGRIDVPLDTIGRGEAGALADALAGMRPMRVVTSPLARAVQTGEAIAARAGAAPPTTAEGLLDRDYGRWAGKPPDMLVDRFGSLDAAPGVEPAPAVAERAAAVLDAQLDCLVGDGVIVLVSHDVVNRLLLARLDPALGPAERIGQRTACWNLLTRAGRSWQVERVDQKAW